MHAAKKFFHRRASGNPPAVPASQSKSDVFGFLRPGFGSTYSLAKLVAKDRRSSSHRPLSTASYTTAQQDQAHIADLSTPSTTTRRSPSNNSEELANVPSFEDWGATLRRTTSLSAHEEGKTTLRCTSPGSFEETALGLVEVGMLAQRSRRRRPWVQRRAISVLLPGEQLDGEALASTAVDSSVAPIASARTSLLMEAVSEALQGVDDANKSGLGLITSIRLSASSTSMFPLPSAFDSPVTGSKRNSLTSLHMVSTAHSMDQAPVPQRKESAVASAIIRQRRFALNGSVRPLNLLEDVRVRAMKGKKAKGTNPEDSVNIVSFKERLSTEVHAWLSQVPSGEPSSDHVPWELPSLRRGEPTLHDKARRTRFNAAHLRRSPEVQFT